MKSVRNESTKNGFICKTSYTKIGTNITVKNKIVMNLYGDKT